MPLFLAEREVWNLVVEPANDLARCYISGRMNLSRQAFVQMIEGAYEERDLAFPGATTAAPAARRATTTH